MARLALTSLPGWAEDDHEAAMASYLKTAMPTDPAWAVPKGAARAYLEASFEAELVAERATLTGYFEPEYAGSLTPSAGFTAPVYGVPERWLQGETFATRAEIETQGLLAGRELAWLATPIDAFLLQVQGSGRIRLPDGSVLRLGFAGKNGHPYVSLGKLLVERREIAADQISMQAIRAWYAANTEAGNRLMQENQSFVFFRPLEGLGPDDGPIGTAGVSLTAMRSVAVDPEHTSLGALVWIDRADTAQHIGLCVAQDTGGAIKGAGRSDLYCGSGTDAGELAGGLYTSVRFLRLMARDEAQP